jgi:hypothetical protein
MEMCLSIYLDYYIDILLTEKPSAPWMDAIVKTLGIADNATQNAFFRLRRSAQKIAPVIGVRSNNF